MNDSNSAVSATSALATAKDYFASLQTVLVQLDLSVIDHMTETVWKNYEEDRTLYIFGNGGSAALASHLACDFGKGTVAANRRRLRTVSLADNVALMTALANDLAYQDIFSEQLAGLATKGDAVLAISGSGNSPNVVRGLEEARRIGLKTLAITGFSGGRVKNLADLCLVVPSDNMQHIEDVHLFATHAIFRALRYRMTLPKA
ncbi:MAG TPA: SIS domain-containing protein [Candidatus Angelobacter sp.]|nr:SIS domain-containing protein [Candidatus Angelobacter sp.]